MQSGHGHHEVSTFPKLFLPELRAEIVSYLALRDLKSYSICSNAFRIDSEPYLWASIVLNPTSADPGGQRISDFCSFLLQNSRRAIFVRSLHIICYYCPSPWRLWSIFPTGDEIATSWSEPQFQTALDSMKALQRLSLNLDHPSFWDVNPPSQFLSALLSAPFRHTLSILHTKITRPFQLAPFVNGYRNLTTLYVESTTAPKEAFEYVGPHLSTESQLAVVCGDSNLLASLPCEKITTFVQSASSPPLDSFEGAQAIGDLFRMCSSLKELSFSCCAVYEAEPSNPLFTNIAHPTLEVLEVSISFDDDDLASDEQVQPDELLLHFFRYGMLASSFPSLTTLHLILSHRELVPMFVPDFDEIERFSNYRWGSAPVKAAEGALCRFLSSEVAYSGAALRRVWIDCDGDYEGFVSAIRFSAEKLNGEWSVDAQVCNYQERLLEISEATSQRRL
ncbi:hypothetical protein DL93DRAFT_2168987 [Clavulina sp. PMI_390]|nr:hypothetical protein DL93DRAFT_2168987 [Clavulina sp. PMI_390]